jgi:hypothetical protein
MRRNPGHAELPKKMKPDFDYKTKGEVALHQLDAAIWFFLEKNDAICATTLAGAAEEIFGKLAEAQGKVAVISEFVMDMRSLLQQAKRRHPDIPIPKPQELKDERNYLRNMLKHNDEEKGTGGDSFVIKSDAKDMIDRAINNMFRNSTHPSALVDEPVPQIV